VQQGCNYKIGVSAISCVGNKHCDLQQMINIGLPSGAFPTLMYVPPRGCVSGLEHLEPFLHLRFPPRSFTTRCERAPCAMNLLAAAVTGSVPTTAELDATQFQDGRVAR
jgi:hypothetical protein